MPNDSKLNTSNPSLSVGSGSHGGSEKKNIVDWMKKKSGTALKKVNRLEEKFNQAIGKAQKTEDEIFEANVQQFEQQTQTANLFSKELNKYVNSLREAQKSQKNFFECLKQVYESTWPNYNEIIQQCQKQEELWTHHIDLLQQCVQVPISEYGKEFPEKKKLIEKRGNKLLDYDKAKHTLHDLETSKKIEDYRIQKARVDLSEKQKLFASLNDELHTKLPKLYENRKCVYSKAFKSMFNIEKTFHKNMGESKTVLNDVCEKLILDFGCSDDYSLSDNNTESDYKQLSNGNNTYESRDDKLKTDFARAEEEDEEEEENEEETAVTEEEDKPSSYEFAIDTLGKPNNQQQQQPPLLQPVSSSSSSTSSINVQKSQTNSPVLGSTVESNQQNFNRSSSTKGLFSDILKDLPNGNNYAPPTAQPIHSPPTTDLNTVKIQITGKVLYRVRATYPYQSKEIDELSFNKDDLIDVIEGTESEKEDLDEGWQIGIHCQTNNRGLFPENFTKKI